MSNIIPDDAYSNNSGLSQSGAKELLRSPAHFKQYLERDRSDQTPAQRLGTLIHLASLQPQVFDATIVVAPECDKRTKEGKEIWASFQSSLKPGQEAISQKDGELVTAVSIAARAGLDKLMKDYDGESMITEVPMVGRVNGTDIKGKLDAIIKTKDGRTIVVDIKTTTDAGTPFVRDIANYLDYLQGAWYTTLAHADAFVILAVEKDAPNEWACYTLDAEAQQKGLALMNSAIDLFRSCNTFKQFPGYPKEVQTVSLPKWVQ
ncbi:MAG: PD-(D/E)XK nuclease-like domain-containing protein [Planctomycetia bacterium]|nr:PD-(D/E)XK nuclease-like domain-containing protein [Planctomycetia bacterium]